MQFIQVTKARINDVDIDSKVLAMASSSHSYACATFGNIIAIVLDGRKAICEFLKDKLPDWRKLCPPEPDCLEFAMTEAWRSQWLELAFTPERLARF